MFYDGVSTLFTECISHTHEDKIYMKAAVYRKYGTSDVLELREVEKPVPGDGEVLIKIYATTVNRTDCATIKARLFFMRLFTGLFKPKKQIPGTEFAGEVVETGKGVASLKPGDRVFGFNDMGSESHAQYMTTSEETAVIIPEDTTYEQAAASIEGAHYAYSCIRKVNLNSGQKTLVYGATGAIGSAAVQILVNSGVYVAAVCNTKNVELVKTLGAHKVIDYTKEDFTQDDETYHFVFDAVGKSSFAACKPLLQSGGVYVSTDLGYMAHNLFLPFITPLIKPLIGNKKTLFPMPTDIRENIEFIKTLMEQGTYKSVIERSYTLERIIEAYRYVETGQKTGNVVITVEHDKQ